MTTDLQAYPRSALPQWAHCSRGNVGEATREPRMPFGVMVFAIVAFGTEALWLGLIGWWLLNLF
jgi:hypothetical protein